MPEPKLDEEPGTTAMGTASRQFTLADAMTLVAAVALSLWIGRGRHIERVAAVLWDEGRRGLGRSTALYGLALIRELQPAVAVLTLFVLGLRLRHPRPALRRLACQPGFLAVCAAALVIVLRGLILAAGARFDPATGPPPTDLYLHELLDSHEADLGYGVAAAWLALALGRRWRPERSWIDRLGFAIGLFWIGRILIVFLIALLS
jgi:hypothetical protein